MTLEPSNRILSMVATDIDKVLLKATLVNWYWYCPWFAYIDYTTYIAL